MNEVKVVLLIAAIVIAFSSPIGLTISILLAAVLTSSPLWLVMFMVWWINVKIIPDYK